MDGFVEIKPQDLQTPQGIVELNRMLNRLHDNTLGDGDTVKSHKGYGSPEGVISASVGSIYQRLDGAGGSTIYIKESGSGATGWNAATSTATAGTVTEVSVTTANGVSGTVANPTSTPAISLTLGAITPTSVTASGTVTGSNLSGTNTGDQDSSDFDHNSLQNTHNLSTDIDHDGLTNTHNLSTDIDHDGLTNTHNLTTDIDHNSITNAHNLTTDIDHDSITNGHNLTTDIDHASITNGHNLTTNIFGAANGVLKADGSGNVSACSNLTDTAYATTSTKLDDFGTPDDNTDLDTSTTRHGLCPKLPNSTSSYLRGDGQWGTPTGSGNVTGDTSSTAGNIATFSDTSGTAIEDSGVALSDIQDDITDLQADILTSQGGNDSYTKLLLHMDGADGSRKIYDSSASSHTVDPQADAQIDTAQKVFGTGSCLFDGTGDYLAIPSVDMLTAGGFETGWSTVVSNASIDNEDMADITDWTDSDAINGVSSQVTFDSKSCMKLDSGAATSGTYAYRYQDIGSMGTSTVFSMNVYCDAIGTLANGDCNEIVFYDGTHACAINMASDGLYVLSSAGARTAIGTNPVVQDTWQEWTFVVTWGASATVDIYLNGALHASGVDCAYDSAVANGVVGFVQKGNTTSNRITYIDWFKAGSAFSSACTNTNWTLAGAGAVVTPSIESGKVKVGTYSARLTRVGADCNLTQDIQNAGGKNLAYWKGRQVTFGCWVYATVANRAIILVTDGVDTTSSAVYHSGTAGWEYLTVTHRVSNSATSVTAVCQIYTGNTTAYFDGATVIDGTVTDFQFGSGDFTIDARAMFNSVTSNRTIAAQWGYSTSSGVASWILYRAASDNTLKFGYSTDGYTTIVLKSVSWTPTASVWYHIAVVRSGNDLKFFVDGTQVGSTQDVTGVTIFSSPYPVTVGSGDGGNYFDGWIEELRISKGIARWTADFTKPSIQYLPYNNNEIPVDTPQTFSASAAASIVVGGITHGALYKVIVRLVPSADCALGLHMNAATGASDYRWQLCGRDSSGIFSDGDQADGNIDITHPSANWPESATVYTAELLLDTKNSTTGATLVGNYQYFSASARMVAGTVGGQWIANTANATSFTITPSTGNITGTVSIYRIL